MGRRVSLLYFAAPFRPAICGKLCINRPSYFHSCTRSGSGRAAFASCIDLAIRVTYAGASCVCGWKVHSWSSRASSASRTHAVTFSFSAIC